MGRCIYIPTTASLIEGSLIPQGQRPCVCGSQPFERFWVPGFLDYQYLSLLASFSLSLSLFLSFDSSSCTPTFFPFLPPPQFTLPPASPPYNDIHRHTPSLLSFSFPFFFLPRQKNDLLLGARAENETAFSLLRSIRPVSMANCRVRAVRVRTPRKGEEVDARALHADVPADRGIFIRDRLKPVELPTVNS